jgi:hypothetical protein
MDKNRRTSIFIILGSVAVAVGLYFLLTSDDHYVWSETYYDDGDQPYDLSLFKKTLEGSSEDFEILAGLSADTSFLESNNTTLVYIGGYAFLDSSETAVVKRFASKGNSVFISSRTIGGTLRYLDDCGIADDKAITNKIEADKIRLSTSDKSIAISRDVYNEPTNHSWIYLSEVSCYEVLGNMESDGEKRPNLVSKKIGKGRIVIHSNPLAFTNYHLRRDSVFEYVNAVLATTTGSKYWYLEPNEPIDSDGSDGPNITESPLRFILSNPPLKWAWYLVILATLLYVLNSVRRKQRAIPVQKLPKNQTAEYLDMIYRLFRKEGKHKDIIQSQIKLLQAYLKNKYGLNTHKQNSEFFEVASTKLKLDKKYLEQFFKLLDRARHNSTLSDSDLLEIDREINEFYHRCP